MKKAKYLDRELSWLSFNYRVLQETKSPSVPLYERIKFLAIFSSNLDEFFRVRVASLRALLDLKEKAQQDLKFSPRKLLNDIHETVLNHQTEFGEIFKNSILPELAKNNIIIVKPEEISREDFEFIRDYFKDNIIQHIQPVLVVKNRIIPFLKNRQLYHALRLTTKEGKQKKGTKTRTKHQYAIVEIPTDHVPRFISLPQIDNIFRYIFLDDIVKLCLPEIFPAYHIVDSYSVKLTRDAELYIDDEFTGNLLAKIQKSLNKRSTGAPSRFLYDEKMPKEFLKFLRDSLKLSKDDMVAGAAYHNFNDFFSFPNPANKNLEYEKLAALVLPEISETTDLFSEIKNKDLLMCFPYHTYNHVLDFFEQSAIDPDVTEIKLTQYRVANNSKIVQSLIKAARNGKDVTAFVEVKARFDEESNIRWAEEMEQAGIKVHYSFPGLKVHAKLALIKRRESSELLSYAYLGTGNFNEKTARIYTDLGMLTCNEKLTEEVERVFDFLTGEIITKKFKNLLVAQFNMRKDFTKLIDNEIRNAVQGKEASITLKMNSLEDKKMINKLYKASNHGVKINIIVRGICCLNPGVEGLSENIKVISIVDRFLEHSRIYIFHNDGNPLIFAASADWMKRNLSRRIEVAFPIYQQDIREKILGMIELQLRDNQKARKITEGGLLEYNSVENENTLRSQMEIYNYLKETN